MQDNLKRVVLDYGGIDIKKVQISYKSQHYENVAFKAHTETNQNLGNALEVELPESLSVKEGDEFNMIVYYNTNEKTLAINWLSPSQTAGKKLPYLFTQCESIACRTVAPMMDTPAIKITYSANVTVESDFVAKLSANSTGIVDHANGYKSYLFENQIRMPSYLIAIAVGDLEYRELGPRVGVITEPSQMDKVANELESLQTLLDETENYLTPYIWGNYSILILPPSFPFGGMENPLLTFASPTIIAGDKS
jgi:leukotriene-A4 hydrolase